MNTEIKTKCNCNRYHHNLCPNFLSNPENKADTEIKTKEEWEIKFERNFGFDSEYIKTLPEVLPTEDVSLLIEDIKSFIQTLLASKKEQFATQIIEALEKENNAPDENSAWNHAISEAIEIINKLK